MKIREGKIEALVSSEEELVPIRPVALVEEVEAWMNDLVKAMQVQLAQNLKLSMASQELDFEGMPASILSLTQEIRFARKVQKAIAAGDLPGLKQRTQMLLGEHTHMRKAVSKKLTALKHKSLILDLIHHNEVLDGLIESQCSDIMQWAWFKQLKFFLNENSA